MKKILLLAAIAVIFIAYACQEEEISERFRLITTPVWASDSLLADGQDASGPGGILEKFKGDARFNEDGTGVFGAYTGTWKFVYNETEITITSDSLTLPLTAFIDELTEISLKINTSYPQKNEPDNPLDIRMTFNAK
jgi:hypothetical protein